MKRCAGRCGRVLPLDAFQRDRTKPDGRRARCRACMAAERRERAAERRQRDRDALRADPTSRRSLRRHSATVAALTPPLDPEAAERAARIVARAERELSQ